MAVHNEMIINIKGECPDDLQNFCLITEGGLAVSQKLKLALPQLHKYIEKQKKKNLIPKISYDL